MSGLDTPDAHDVGGGGVGKKGLELGWRRDCDKLVLPLFLRFARAVAVRGAHRIGLNR